MVKYLEHNAPCYPVEEEYVMTRIQNRSHQLPQLFSVMLISNALFLLGIFRTICSGRAKD